MSRFIHLKPAAAGRILPPVTMDIALTDLENQIFSLLNDCAQQLKEEKGLVTKCRIAGGWVRDKVDSRLISFTISIFTFVSYLTAIGLPEQRH
jgi:hypothetical protein